jgi:hypothetical protein
MKYGSVYKTYCNITYILVLRRLFSVFGIIIIIIIIIKKLKYKSLRIEIQRMWNLKCTIVPVIIGATGTVTRS